MFWFSLVFGVVLLTSGWVIYSFLYSITEKRIMEQLINSNKAVVEMLETTSTVVIRDRLKVIAEKNIDILKDFYSRYRQGLISEEDAHKSAEQILLSQRIGESGYIYVLDGRGRLVIHPYPDMKGRDMSDDWLAQTQIAKKNGFQEYKWANSDEEIAHEKVLYMAYFEPWDWIVSVSSYRKDFRSLFSIKDFWSGVEAFHFGQTGHSFILYGNGEKLISPSHSHNSWENSGESVQFVDSATLQYIIEQKNGELIVPTHASEEVGEGLRQTVFQYLPYYDWIIVSTVDLDEEFLPLGKLRRIIFSIIVVALLLSLPISLYVGSQITRPLAVLIGKMNNGKNGGKDADEEAIGEVGVLARKFNLYIKRLNSSHLELKSEITMRIEVEQQLKLFAKVFENALEGITITDAGGDIIAVNRAFTDITGYEAAEAIGKNPKLLKSDRHDDAFYRDMWQSLRERGSWVGEIWNRRKNGEAYPEILSISSIYGSDGNATHYVAVFHDITDMKRKEEQIRHQAYHDALTGLPNRSLANDRLEMAILHAKRVGTKVALFFLDLDHFKKVNDSLGHAFGDRLLQKAGKRLLEIVREEDTVARLGGDEFLVIAVGISSEQQLIELAERLVGCFAYPFQVDRHELHITFSIGITLYPDDGENIADLTRNADVAMYQAKQQGRNSYSLFTPELSERASCRMQLEKELRQAIKERRFVVFYQPKICLHSNRVSGLEALVRWKKADGTMMSPSEFIPPAEETGLIIPLGEIVLEESCRAMQHLDNLGLDHMKVAVNLSPVQFLQPQLISRTLAILEECNFEPSRLELEITETTMMTNLQEGVHKLNQLVDEGISISIDDFGTGYSSLYYLKNLPIDTIKIDQTFIRDITHDFNDAQIVETIILMAKNLGIGVVAEGVETAEQLELLSRFHCEQVQGYYFSRPLPLEELVEYLYQRESDNPLGN
jgi:diguanylate cyclase (GGDEF)-like protein/PAS domain S-box-containing protein